MPNMNEITEFCIEIIESCLSSPSLRFDFHTTLAFDKNEDDIEEDIDYEDEDEYGVEVQVRISINSKKEAVDYWIGGKKGKRKWESVANRYRFVKSERQLYRFKDQVENFGSREEKLKQVWHHTLENFKNARVKKLIVHDNDLRRWGLKAAGRINFLQFKASRSWVYKFKKANGICSRKITKFVSTKFVQETENIVRNANAFLETAKTSFPSYRLDHIFNTDQSGFNYEMTTGRTLSHLGEKATEASVTSLHATTHSYTIQPTINLDGKLLSPLFLCLQEPDGKFGPRV